MRATNFLANNSSIDVWAKLAEALAFPVPLSEPSEPATQSADQPGIFERLFDRLDRWFWNQEMKEREAWLAKSQDIFELERRIRMLERVGSRYY